MLQTQVTNPEVATFQSFSKGVYEGDTFVDSAYGVCLQFI